MTYAGWFRLIGTVCIIGSVLAYWLMRDLAQPLWGFGLGMAIAGLVLPDDLAARRRRLGRGKRAAGTGPSPSPPGQVRDEDPQEWVVDLVGDCHDALITNPQTEELGDRLADMLDCFCGWTAPAYQLRIVYADTVPREKQVSRG